MSNDILENLFGDKSELKKKLYRSWMTLEIEQLAEDMKNTIVEVVGGLEAVKFSEQEKIEIAEEFRRKYSEALTEAVEAVKEASE